MAYPSCARVSPALISAVLIISHQPGILAPAAPSRFAWRGATMGYRGWRCRLSVPRARRSSGGAL